MKVALVHDHLVQDGGAERVLSALQAVYPDAPTYVLFHDRKRANPEFLDKDIRTSFLQKIPGGVSHYQWLLPLMPAAVERLDLSDYDVVLSSSSGFSKGIITRPGTLHLCYCHTPTRYLWSDTHSYLDDLRRGPLVKAAVHTVLPRLRLWDQAAAHRVDKFIANSETVAKRITKYYRRTSDVIHPPVELARFTVSHKPGSYYLIGGRVVHYKRFDLAVEAFSRLGIPLKVFGEGPALEELRERAAPNVEFLGRVNDDEKAYLYRDCIAFLHPQEEDFGITAIEAMAAGRPVIAYPVGGALETVVPGVTGEFMREQSWEALADAVLDFKPEKYDSNKIREHVEQFSTDNFQKKIRSYVDARWQEYQGGGSSE
jgi:glycosyltransferase involved in cell wall biosynthesis